MSQLKFFKINQMVSLFIVLASTSGCGLFNKDYVATSKLVTGYSFDGAYRTLSCCISSKDHQCPAVLCAMPDFGTYQTREKYFEAQSQWKMRCVNSGYEVDGCNCVSVCSGKL